MSYPIGRNGKVRQRGEAFDYLTIMMVERTPGQKRLATGAFVPSRPSKIFRAGWRMVRSHFRHAQLNRHRRDRGNGVEGIDGDIRASDGSHACGAILRRTGHALASGRIPYGVVRIRFDTSDHERNKPVPRMRYNAGSSEASFWHAGVGRAGISAAPSSVRA